MKRMLLVGAIAFVTASGAAFAQSSQGQAGAQAGVSGNAPNAPDSTMPNYVRPGETTGMDNGVVEPDRAPEAPVMKSPSDGESTQGNVGPGTMTPEPR